MKKMIADSIPAPGWSTGWERVLPVPKGQRLRNRVRSKPEAVSDSGPDSKLKSSQRVASKLRECLDPRKREEGKQIVLRKESTSTQACLTHDGVFLPSDELMDVVRESIQRKQLSTAMRQRAAEGTVAARRMPGETGGLEHDAPWSREFEEELRAHAGRRVTNFLVTIARGAALTSPQLFPITVAGSVIESILAGFLLRVPVSLAEVARFDKILVRDLRRAAAAGFQVGKYAKVVTVGEVDLALKPIFSPRQSERG